MRATAAATAVSAAAQVLAVAPSYAVTASSISTYAGQPDAPPFSGDGQAPTQAGLGQPVALAVDGANVYVAERLLGAKFQEMVSIVRRLEGRVRVSRVAGRGDEAYVLGSNGWTRTGPMAQGNASTLALSLVAGIVVRESVAFVSLVDADGTGVIARLDAAGNVTVIAGGGTHDADGPAIAARLAGPAGLALLPDGNLLVAEAAGHRVRKVTTAGRIETVAGGASLATRAVPPPANKPAGTPFFTFDLDAVGDGGPATGAVLQGPQGLAIDGGGSIYVTEAAGHRVRRIDTNGVIVTVAGTGRPGFSGDGAAAMAAQLHAPQGVAVDASGNVFVGDTYNARVRVVSSGVITTLAGTGETGFSGDGGPPSRATFRRPGALVLLSGTGPLLVADEGNRVIRQITLV